jgi:hypothetical protein
MGGEVPTSPHWSTSSPLAAVPQLGLASDTHCALIAKPWNQSTVETEATMAPRMASRHQRRRMQQSIGGFLLMRSFSHWSCSLPTTSAHRARSLTGLVARLPGWQVGSGFAAQAKNLWVDLQQCGRQLGRYQTTCGLYDQVIFSEAPSAHRQPGAPAQFRPSPRVSRV